ncbi:hypothetical protein V6N11_059520 [Hibiscus sabdariffa]|uniref:Uncharacterized protein n=1 Tax=Hibiscus sabdariffa TaxID=183260 RepID=A0ABR2ABN4_9ROSI
MGESGGSSGGVCLCNLDYMYASNWKSMVLKVFLGLDLDVGIGWLFTLFAVFLELGADSFISQLQAQEELLACFVLEAYVDFGYGQIWRLIAYCGVARSRKELEVRLVCWVFS